MVHYVVCAVVAVTVMRVLLFVFAARLLGCEGDVNAGVVVVRLSVWFISV